MEKRSRFVGLDVHKASIAVAVADAFGDPEDHGQIANDPSAVRRLMQRMTLRSSRSSTYWSVYPGGVATASRAPAGRTTIADVARAAGVAGRTRCDARLSAALPYPEMPPLQPAAHTSTIEH